MHDAQKPGPTKHMDGRLPARGIPAHWIRFLDRVAGLRRGYVYTIALIVPEKANEDPQ